MHVSTTLAPERARTIGGGCTRLMRGQAARLAAINSSHDAAWLAKNNRERLWYDGPKGTTNQNAFFARSAVHCSG